MQIFAKSSFARLCFLIAFDNVFMISLAMGKTSWRLNLLIHDDYACRKIHGNEMYKFKGLRSIAALVIREMTTTYGRSPGGYFWAVAEPVVGIALLSVIFAIALRLPPMGINFQIFYATGFLPFIIYREIENKLASSIRFSQALLFYPSIVYTDAMIARFVLTVVTQLMVFYLVIMTILVIWDTRTLLEPSLIISSLAAAAILAAGVGTINCVLISFFPIWERIWAILNRPLVIMSGVIFVYDDVPQPWREYLWYNPLIHIVGQMRRGFYPSYRGEYIEMMYPIGVGMILLVIGLILLNRYNREILNLY
jgi:capsular polysaccharide transport system permease protein